MQMLQSVLNEIYQLEIKWYFSLVHVTILRYSLIEPMLCLNLRIVYSDIFTIVDFLMLCKCKKFVNRMTIADIMVDTFWH